MKVTRNTCAALLIALIFGAQLLTPAHTARAAQQSPRYPIDTPPVVRPTPQPVRRANCRTRCLRAYRLCQRGIVPPNVARCRERLRHCLRRCRG